jgi:hypothetical protein
MSQRYEYRVMSCREGSQIIYKTYQTQSGALARVQRLRDTAEGQEGCDDPEWWEEPIAPLVWLKTLRRPVGEWEAVHMGEVSE